MPLTPPSGTVMPDACCARCNTSARRWRTSVSRVRVVNRDALDTPVHDDLNDGVGWHTHQPYTSKLWPANSAL